MGNVSICQQIRAIIDKRESGKKVEKLLNTKTAEGENVDVLRGIIFLMHAREMLTLART
jgi:hypothetical protein